MADNIKEKENGKAAKEHRVAVFFDYENIVYSLRNRFEQKANFEALINKCKELGRIVEARAFADWGLPYMSPALMYALQSSGFDLIFVPTGSTQSNAPRKNVADLYMAIHVMQVLHTREDIDTFVLLTGDRDFMPLVNHLKRQGKRTVAIGVDGSSSYYLTQAVDEFFYYSEVEQNFEEKPRRLKGRPTNIYDALVQSVQIMREKGRAARLTNIKPVMIELLGGFDEKEFTDAKGRNFRQFKDFVQEAERRGLVRILTRGNINEVILLTDSEEAIAAAAAIDDDLATADELPAVESTPVAKTAPPARKPAPVEETLSLQAAFKLLVQAVQAAQDEGRSFRASSVKHRMIKAYPSFDEKAVVNARGENFTRFSDFLDAAAEQGLVKLTGTGVKTEVLPVKEYGDTEQPVAEKEPPEKLEGDAARAAILAGLRAYSNYPTSFLSLASFAHRWLDGQNKLVDEQLARELMTEAVEIDLLLQTTKPDGRKQYELQASEHLITRFLRDAAEMSVVPTAMDDMADEADADEEEAPPAQPIIPLPAKLEDPFEALSAAVRVILAEGKDPVLPRVKSALIKLMPDFDESKVENPNGGRFAKFKDFVLEGERRRLVRLEIEGTVNRVFLPLPQVAGEPAAEEAQVEATDAGSDALGAEAAEAVAEAAAEAVAETVAQVSAGETKAPATEPAAAAQAAEAQSAEEEVPAYLEYQHLTPLEQRALLVDALRSFNDYPAAFMAILAHCRTVRDARKVYLAPNELRDLLSDATRTPLVRAVSPRGERPTLYGFFDDAAAVEAYITTAPSAVEDETPAATPAPAAEPPKAEAKPAEPKTPEPKAKPVSSQQPAKDFVDSLPSSGGAPAAEAPMRGAIARALLAFDRYPAPFLSLLEYATEYVARNNLPIQGDLRGLLSEATRSGLLHITSARGMRPTLYSLDSSDSTVALYLRTRAAAPVPAETVSIAEPIETEPTAPQAAAEPEAEQPSAERPDIFALLAEAIKTLQGNDKSTVFSSVKRQMKELLDDFDESNYNDADGKPYKRFKDFIEDAEARGVVVMTTSGKALAVALPDPAEAPEGAVDETPVAEAPATDEPATEVPATDEPATDEPATEAPAAEEPVAEAPVADAPAADAPASDEQPTAEDVTAADEEGEAAAAEAPAAEPDAPRSSDPLTAAFELTRAAVQAATEEGRSLRLASLRNRIVKLDETFEPGNLHAADGKRFKSFTDFMRAAEAAGYIQLSGEGTGIQANLA